MVFSSALFLFIFLPVTIAVYFLLPGVKLKNYWLFVVSLLFYAWGEPVYICLMVGSIVFNYFCARVMDSRSTATAKKRFLVFDIVVNIALLVCFKYLDFIIVNINAVLQTNIQPVHLSLPIGISFYTFQILSYVVDVYRGTVPVQNSIVKLGVYISLFPQLIAGPIVRYEVIARELDSRTVSLDDVYEGCRQFIYGLTKKVILADTVSGIADAAFSMTNLNCLFAWMGIVAYTLQIYFDFSGYSDMAIGLGRIFGFHFNHNFNYPYISASPQEFWRRWHISLSTWFRDYVYIPLGGSRISSVRTYVNKFAVFFLTGLWHGASWNFVVWGLFHGIMLIIDDNLKQYGKFKFNKFSTMLCVMIAWVFFRAADLHAALAYIKTMFSFSTVGMWSALGFFTQESAMALLLALLLSTPLYERIKDKVVFRRFEPVYLFMLFVLSLSYVMGVGFSPFLYFRF